MLPDGVAGQFAPQTLPATETEPPPDRPQDTSDRLHRNEHATHQVAQSDGPPTASRSRTLTRALILAEGFRLQYRVLRCAVECFDEVFVLGAAGADQLRYSRFCKRYIRSDRSFADMQPDDVCRIDRLCHRLQIDMVLPSCGETTRFLSLYGDRLGVACYPVPSCETFDILNSKLKFARACTALGVPVPRTHVFDTAEALRCAAASGGLSFPLVLKPDNMWGSFGVRRVDTPDHLPERIDYAPIICQEYIPGRDISAFYICKAGRVVNSFVYSRSNAKLVCLQVEHLDEYAQTIVGHFRYDGTIGFDARRDPDGRIAFIECNPRFWYRMDVAMIAGLNFVTLGCEMRQERHVGDLGRVELRSPRRLCRNILTPWRLNAVERAYLGYLTRDPIINAWAGLRSALGANRIVRGQQL